MIISQGPVTEWLSRLGWNVIVILQVTLQSHISCKSQLNEHKLSKQLELIVFEVTVLAFINHKNREFQALAWLH